MKEITHANCTIWSAVILPGLNLSCMDGWSAVGRCPGVGQRASTKKRNNTERKELLTAEIEMVARAKGSPIMLPVLTPRRPYCLEFSILRRDGE